MAWASESAPFTRTRVVLRRTSTRMPSVRFMVGNARSERVFSGSTPPTPVTTSVMRLTTSLPARKHCGRSPVTWDLVVLHSLALVVPRSGGEGARGKAGWWHRSRLPGTSVFMAIHSMEVGPGDEAVPAVPVRWSRGRCGKRRPTGVRDGHCDDCTGPRGRRKRTCPLRPIRHRPGHCVHRRAGLRRHLGEEGPGGSNAFLRRRWRGNQFRARSDLHEVLSTQSSFSFMATADSLPDLPEYVPPPPSPPEPEEPTATPTSTSKPGTATISPSKTPTPSVSPSETPTADSGSATPNQTSAAETQTPLASGSPTADDGTPRTATSEVVQSP